MSLSVIHKGEKAHVYHFQSRELECAVKAFHRDYLSLFQMERDLSSELSTHPMLGVFQPLDERVRSILSERIPHIEMRPVLCAPYLLEDLYSFIDLTNERGIPLDLIRKIARQLAASIVWLHSKKIVHRDIKTENIGFDGTVHLRDFDLSVKLGELGEKMQGMRGTIANMCPEMLLYGEYSYKCDWWAFGTVVWELYTGNSFLFHIPPHANPNYIRSLLFVQFYQMFKCELRGQFRRAYRSHSRKIGEPYFSWQMSVLLAGAQRKDPPIVIEQMISFLSQFLQLEQNRGGWQEVISHDFLRERVPRPITTQTVQVVKKGHSMSIVYDVGGQSIQLLVMIKGGNLQMYFRKLH